LGEDARVLLGGVACTVSVPFPQKRQIKSLQTRMWANAQCDGMAALPNTGGAQCSTPQSFADAQYWNAVQ